MKVGEYYEGMVQNHVHNKVLEIIMYVMPHLITSIIIAYIFPKMIIGIILFGVIIPDFAFYEHFLFNKLKIKKDMTLELRRKKVAHYFTFFVGIFLIYGGLWPIALSSYVHLMLDYIGF